MAATPIPSPIALASDIPLDSPTSTSGPTQAPESTPPPGSNTADVDLLFADEAIDGASGWRQLNVHNAAFDLEDGELASTYVKKGSWAYAVHQLGVAETVVRVGGRFTSSGLGYFGWLCGDSSAGRYYGAVPETDGSLVFIDGGYGGVEPVERYEDLGAPIASGVKTMFGLECAIDHGTLWMQALLDGEPIAAHEVENVTDATRFDVLGMYGESLDPPFTTSVTDIVARGTNDGTGSISFAGLPLANYAQPAAASAESGELSCLEAPLSSAATAAVTCYLQDEGNGPELLQLSTYADAPGTAAAYASDDHKPPCASGLSTTLWSRGVVRCVSQPVGIDLEWSDSALNVVGHLIDFDGDTTATQSVWTTIVSAN
jgi:hypothetical protein